jgi:hypothetical protein
MRWIKRYKCYWRITSIPSWFLRIIRSYTSCVKGILATELILQRPSDVSHQRSAFSKQPLTFHLPHFTFSVRCFLLIFLMYRLAHSGHRPWVDSSIAGASQRSLQVWKIWGRASLQSSQYTAFSLLNTHPKTRCGREQFSAKQTLTIFSPGIASCN